LISDTRVSLTELSAAELLDLGGLKTHCSAQIKCTEHSHIVPCEICLLEDRVGSFCDACGKNMDTPPVPGERACASVEQFKSTGRVAFEEEAVAGLAERDSRSKPKKDKKSPSENPRSMDGDLPAPHGPSSTPSVETKHERTEVTSSPTDGTDRKVWDEFKRKHLGDYYVPPRRRPRVTTPASTETKTDTVIELRKDTGEPTSAPAGDGRLDIGTPSHVEKRPRRRRERSPVKTEGSTSVYEPPTAPKHIDRRNADNDLIAKLSIWASLIAAIVGGYVMFHSPWVEGGSRSIWYALSFAAATLFIWFAGVNTLYGREPAHGTMHWLSPVVWAFFTAPWPAIGAYLLCKTGSPGQGLATGVFVFIIGLIAAFILIYQLFSCGTRLTMDSPWPVPMNDESGTSDDWLWAKIIATLVLNIYLWDFGSAMWRQSQVAQVTAPTLSVQLDKLVTAVNAVEHPARLRAGPEMDRITQALAAIDAQKKPAAGNVDKARKLQAEAMKFTKKGDWKNAYPLLKTAHDVAPGVDSIGVMLGLTESMTGRAAEARAHLTEALTINPRNSAGWRTLGSMEIRDGKGSEASIDRASTYYMASWWFAQDRKRGQQLLDREAAGNASIENAVKRVRKKIKN
jgi:hypothetical protein